MTSPLDLWVPAPVLSEPQLSGTFWSFGTLGETPYTPFLVLAPDGLIGNYRNPNEDMWQVTNGQLAFVTNRGVASTIYDAAQLRDGEVVALAGRVLVPGYTQSHQLRRVAHPPHPAGVSPPGVARRATFLTSLDRPSRPNLVVLRAGEGSLHSQWPRDIADTDRNWDLCISYYGADPGALHGSCEFLTHQPHQKKFQAIHDLFTEDSPLSGYDRVWLPDDDLMVSWSDINNLFHLSRRYGLDLAQPSLQPRPDCYIAHWFTAQQPGSILRYIGFVEIMCPVFSGRALRVCVGSFRDSVSGFGLDHLWPALLGGPRSRMAIIDAVGIVHTRPMGTSYDVAQAHAEERALLDCYHWNHYHLPSLQVTAD